MKKRCLSLILFIFLLIGSIPTIVLAAPSPGGILRGVCTDACAANQTNLTDGNESTSLAFGVGGLVTYTLSGSVSATTIYYHSSNTIKVTFSDINNSVLYNSGNLASNSASTNWTMSTGTIPNVHKITLQNISGNNMAVYEFDVQALPPPPPPPIPTGLNVTGTNGAVTVTWNAVTSPNLAGYNIYVNGQKTNSSIITGTNFGLAVVVNQGLQYQVTSVDSLSGESARSAIVTYSSADTIPPPVPTGLHATSDSSSIHLYWDVVNASDFAGYRVYKNGVLLYTSNYAGLINYNDTGLASETSYSYQVTAYDTSGNESAKSTALAYSTIDIAPPTGLAATAGDSQVLLHWTANTESDLQGYNVYQGTTKLNGSPITGTSYTVASGLTNTTTYSFTVSAVNTTGKESAKSAAVTATPLNSTPPAYPTGLTGTAGLSQVDLQWTANSESDLKGYNVFQGGTKLNGTPITATTFHVTGLTNGQTYNFTVSAINTSGFESTQSVIKSLTPLNSTPPAVPMGFTAAAGDRQIFLNWTANGESDIKGYNVYLGSNKVNGAPITGTAYTAVNLTNGTSYSFTVSAVNTSGFESNKSAVQNATPIPPPAIPQGLAADAGDTKVTLSWTANTEINLRGYFIYKDGTKINNTPILGTSYVVGFGLTNYTTYSFTISSIDTEGYQSAQSQAVDATPIDLTPPAIPSGLTGTAGNNKVTLNWAANTDVDLRGYHVYQGTTRLTGSPLTVTNFIVNSLTNGTGYNFAITSVDLEGNESAKSPYFNITPMAVDPPTGLTALNDLDGLKIVLSWDTPAQPSTTYIIYRDGVQVATSTTPTYSDTAVTSGHNYSYDVVAVDTAGNQSNKSNVKSYFSKSAANFTSSSGNGFTASDIVRNAGAFLYVFVGLIVLVASIKFARPIQSFIFSVLNIVKNQGKQTKDKDSKGYKVDLEPVKQSVSSIVIEPLKREPLPKIDFSRTAIPKVEQRDFKKIRREPRPTNTKVTKRNYDVIHKETVQRRKQATSTVIPKLKRKRGFTT
jgi:chitodextrinase